MKSNGNVVILGAGAMGSWYGSLMQRAGCDVQLLDIWHDHIDQINDKGLQLTGPDGTAEIIQMNMHHVDQPLLRPADLLIVFVDTNALDDVLPILEPMLSDNGVVLTLQNGVGNVEKLIATLGANRVIAGTSMNSCELLGPGQVRHVIHGTTILGEIGGSAVSERIRDIAGLLSRRDTKVEAVADIMPQVWSKLVINCAINPLCALTGLLPGQLQEVDETKNLQAGIVAEIEALCLARGIVLPDENPLEEVWRKSRGSNNKPSMVQHLERGRRTEINALNGAVTRLAAEVDVATPVNETITSLIKGLERTALLPT